MHFHHVGRLFDLILLLFSVGQSSSLPHQYAVDRFINWAVGSGARLRGYQSVGGLCDGGNLENATRSTTPQSNPICRFVLRNLTPCPMVYGGSIGSDRKVGFVGLQGDMGRSSLVTRARQSKSRLGGHTSYCYSLPNFPFPYFPPYPIGMIQYTEDPLEALAGLLYSTSCRRGDYWVLASWR